MIYLLAKAERALCSRHAALVCSTCTALFFLGAFLSTPLLGQALLPFGDNIGMGPDFSSPQSLAVEADGSLVMGAHPRWGRWSSIFRIDPVTGDRMIVSDDTTGSGPGLLYPSDLVVEADSSIVALDLWRKAVVRIDPISGDRMIVSDDTTGSGPVFSSPRGLAIEADGSLVVTYKSERGPTHEVLMRVDPVSGDRTIISDHTTGSGPNLISSFALAVEADNSIVALDRSRKAVMRIDPVSGDRMIVSDDATGSGPVFLSPAALAIEADGSLVVADDHHLFYRVASALVRIDPVSGDRTIISNDTTGIGPVLFSPTALAIEADGSLVVANDYDGAIADAAAADLVRIDPVSGDRTVFSFSVFGVGIEDETEVPERFLLTGAYPNPFQTTTHIGYELQSPYPVELVVYDAVGRQVEVLVSSTQPAGLYEASFEAEGLPNGVYFYRLSAGSSTKTGQMVLFR